MQIFDNLRVALQLFFCVDRMLQLLRYACVCGYKTCNFSDCASMTLIIAACTNRKSRRPATDLSSGTLPTASVEDLAHVWIDRLGKAENFVRAGELYAGRGPAIAVRLSTELPAQLKFVSAGLGVVDAERRVPAYDLTVAPSVDGIARRVTPAERFDAREWWGLVTAQSPFGGSLRQAMQESGNDLVLVALPSIYLCMLEREFASLEADECARLRIFTGASGRYIPTEIVELVMPYDQRLDGPDSDISGTRSDFPMRALAHFARTILPNCRHVDVNGHAEAVHRALAGWRLPTKIANARYEDDELRALVGKHWERARGQSGKMLRLFRGELGIACEQSRMSRLVAEVRNRRDGK